MTQLNKNQKPILGDLKPSNPLPSLNKNKPDINKLVDSSSNEFLMGFDDENIYKKDEIIKRNDKMLQQEEIMLNKQREYARKEIQKEIESELMKEKDRLNN